MFGCPNPELGRRIRKNSDVLSTVFVLSGTHGCSHLDSCSATEINLSVFSREFGSRFQGFLVHPGFVKKGILTFCVAGVLRKEHRKLRITWIKTWCFCMLHVNHSGKYRGKENAQSSASPETASVCSGLRLCYWLDDSSFWCQELLLPDRAWPHNQPSPSFLLLPALLPAGPPIGSCQLFCSRTSTEIPTGSIFCLYLRL